MTTSDSKRIHTGRVQHLTSPEVKAEIDAKYGVDGPELSDGAAMAIASWYQHGGTIGMVFHRV